MLYVVLLWWGYDIHFNSQLSTEYGTITVAGTLGLCSLPSTVLRVGSGEPMTRNGEMGREKNVEGV